MIAHVKQRPRDAGIVEILKHAPELDPFFSATSLAEGCKAVLDQYVVPDGKERDAVDLVQRAAALHGRLCAWLRPAPSFSASLAIMLQQHDPAYDPLVIHRAKLQQMQQELVIDELTGLHNRRYINQALRKELDRYRRFNRPISILMADVDRFKRYNDRYGHGAGDAALQLVGRILGAGCRTVDRAARYGGEEFLLLLPDTDQEHAVLVAERIRRLVANTPFPHRELRVSIGVASATPGCQLEDLLLAADKSLYRAKQLGRNRVCISSQDNRSAARIPVHLPVRLRPRACPAREMSGEMINISSNGALICVEGEMPELLAEQLAVQLTVLQKDDAPPQQATIIRAEQWNGNCKKFSLGLQLASGRVAESRWDAFINNTVLKLHQPHSEAWRPQ